MAIIQKDGFYHSVSENNSDKVLVLTGLEIEKEIDYIRNNGITGLYITFGYYKGDGTLDFLSEIPFIKKLMLNHVNLNIDGIYHLKNLTYLTYNTDKKKYKLDFSQFQFLEEAYIEWHPSFPELSFNKQLKTLHLWKYNPKSKSLENLVLPTSLTELRLVHTNITSLVGSYPFIKKLGIHYGRNLHTLKGIDDAKKIEYLTVRNCKKLTEYSDIANCPNLQEIYLTDNGNIKTLKWLKKLPKLKVFNFYDTILDDGDLGYGFNIDSFVFKDRKGYSHKEKDFL